ncbi:hypothetical protein M513_02776, partial [Trichuris suis]
MAKLLQGTGPMVLFLCHCGEWRIGGQNQRESACHGTADHHLVLRRPWKKIQRLGNRRSNVRNYVTHLHAPVRKSCIFNSRREDNTMTRTNVDSHRIDARQNTDTLVNRLGVLLSNLSQCLFTRLIFIVKSEELGYSFI